MIKILVKKDSKINPFQEQKAGNIKSNISGVAMGNSWISPLDSTLSWSEFLYHVSLVDRAGAIEIDQAAQKAKEAYDKGDYKQSTKEWSKTEGVVLRVTEGVDFYNILTKPTKGFWRNQYHRSVHGKKNHLS